MDSAKNGHPTAPSQQRIAHKVQVVTNLEEFEQILTEAGNKLVVFEFFANWCGPCRMMAQKLEELADTYGDKAVIAKIDVEAFEDIAVEFGVTSMPTFLFMRNKQKLEQFSGSNSDKIFKVVEKYCGLGKDSEGGSQKSTNATSVPTVAASKK